MTSPDTIRDPSDEYASIHLEAYLNRQGWHRQPIMAGKTLDNFTADRTEMEERKKFAYAYANGGYETKPYLFLTGAAGRGKTHMARGIMAEMARRGVRGVYWPLVQLLAHLKTMMNKEGSSPDTEIDWLCRFKGLLVIDEIGRSTGNVWDKDQVLYPLLDMRLDKPTIWISNYSSADLVRIYDEAIVSRLESGRIMAFKSDFTNWRRP